MTEPECTGMSAQWCPIHGDCICDREAGELNNPLCPLHCDLSDHAEAPEVDFEQECARLRASNARLIEALRPFAECPPPSDNPYADGECKYCHAARVLREETNAD